MRTVYEAADGTLFGNRNSCAKYEKETLGFSYYNNAGEVPEDFEDATIIWIGHNGIDNFRKFFQQIQNKEHLCTEVYEDIDCSGLYFWLDVYEKFFYVGADELMIMSNFYQDNRKELMGE